MGTVLAIVVISYIIGVIAKLIPVVKDEFIPAIVGVAGGIASVKARREKKQMERIDRLIDLLIHFTQSGAMERID